MIKNKCAVINFQLIDNDFVCTEHIGNTTILRAHSRGILQPIQFWRLYKLLQSFSLLHQQKRWNNECLQIFIAVTQEVSPWQIYKDCHYYSSSLPMTGHFCIILSSIATGWQLFLKQSRTWAVPRANLIRHLNSHASTSNTHPYCTPSCFQEASTVTAQWPRWEEAWIF